MIAVGTYIVCYLKNSLSIEGIVKEFNSHLTLEAPNKDILILMNPKEEILLIKILAENPITKQQKIVAAKNEFQAIATKEVSSDLRNKKLADLKKLLNEEEKKRLIDQAKSHVIGNSKKPVQYGGIPSQFLKIKSLK